MSVSTQYYTLKHESFLPTGSKFIDPYTGKVFVTEANETFPQFLARISENRRKENTPELSDLELRSLVMISLAEGHPKDIVDKYFFLESVPPQFDQVVSLAKALLGEILYGDTVPVLTRQNRAQHCLKCPFHNSTAIAPAVFSALIGKVLAKGGSYPEEGALGTCGMCGCHLPNKVKFQLMNVLAGLSPDNMDLLFRSLGKKAFSTCWMLNESLGNAPAKQLLKVKLRNSQNGGEKLLNEYISDSLKEAKKDG